MMLRRALSSVSWAARFSIWLPLLIAICGAGTIEVAQAAPPTVSADHAKKAAKGLDIFRASVGKLLREKCVSCHGRDATEGSFSLATRKALLTGGKSGPVVSLGKGKQSKLYRLSAHLEKPHMPKDEPKLSETELEALAAWIDNEVPYAESLVKEPLEVVDWTKKSISASDRKFWSFQPVRVSTPGPLPQSAMAAARSDIDRYLLAKLQPQGLTFNPEASRRILIRRAKFDLLGLPPTVEEIEEFLQDRRPDAYERLIDRLLANPAYGERWGRHWLDLARFAESHGFEHDYDRPTAYHYRDFVVRALNDNLPYDQFVKWQMAGDEFAPKNPLAMMATGFLASGVHSTQITANEVEKHRYDELDDMLATTTTAMIGLTVGCARCHDHKYDPIPQADYYRLLSAFTTTIRSEVGLDFDEEATRIAKRKYETEHAPLVAAVTAFERDELPARFARWEKSVKFDSLPRWNLLQLDSAASSGNAKFETLDDGSSRVSGPNANFDTYTLTARTRLNRITAVRLEALADPALVKGGPGRASNGNFALTDFRVTMQRNPVTAGSTAAADKASGNGRASGQSTSVPIPLRNAKATFEQKGLPVAAAIDNQPKSGWAIDPQFGKNHAAVFETATEIETGGDALLTFTLKFEGNTGHNIGRFRLSITSAPPPVGLEGDAMPAAIRQLLTMPREQRTAAQQAQLLQWGKRYDEKWRGLQAKVDEHSKLEPKPTLVKVLVSTEGAPALRLHSQGADFFPETYFLRRGDVQQKQGTAKPGYLQVLMTAPKQEAKWKITPPQSATTSWRRASLANWMTDVEDGAGSLLARVIANRLWQHHFGRGIVSTPSDFGLRGAAPSHPELLDFLAAKLIQSSWDLKSLHRQIMTSAAYRQTSTVIPDKEKIDRENIFVWRQSQRRLEGEAIRDALLSVSGRLDRRMFGPGTLDESSQRRSIYFTVKRSQLIPMMQVFDQPDASTGIGERPSTTIAPQALTLLNSPYIRAAAQQFAESIDREDVPVAEVIRRAYLTSVGREPSSGELRDASQFVTQLVAERLQKGTSTGVPASAPVSVLTARRLALADFCQVLLCLNEFVYVD